MPDLIWVQGPIDNTIFPSFTGHEYTTFLNRLSCHNQSYRRAISLDLNLLRTAIQHLRKSFQSRTRYEERTYVSFTYLMSGGGQIFMKKSLTICKMHVSGNWKLSERWQQACWPQMLSKNIRWVAIGNKFLIHQPSSILHLYPSLIEAGSIADRCIRHIEDLCIQTFFRYCVMIGEIRDRTVVMVASAIE